MTRDPDRIGPLLGALEAYWFAHPDLRLGQIIGNIARDNGHGNDPFYMEDDSIISYLRNHGYTSVETQGGGTVNSVGAATGDEQQPDIPGELLDAVDARYEERGYTSREAAIHDAIRDWLNAPNPFTDETREILAEARNDIEYGRATPFKDILHEHDIDARSGSDPRPTTSGEIQDTAVRAAVRKMMLQRTKECLKALENGHDGVDFVPYAAAQAHELDAEKPIQIREQARPWRLSPPDAGDYPDGVEQVNRVDFRQHPDELLREKFEVEIARLEDTDDE